MSDIPVGLTLKTPDLIIQETRLSREEIRLRCIGLALEKQKTFGLGDPLYLAEQFEDWVNR